jgi:hypothetical protein
MKTRTCLDVHSVVCALEKYTTMSVETFYKVITQNNTNFDYDINVYDRYMKDFTPLHMACRTGNITLVEALIKMGAYINPITSEGKTPLDEAIKKNNQALIEILKYFGAKSADKKEWRDAGIFQSFKTALSENNVKNLAEILNNNLIRLPSYDTARASRLKIAAEEGYSEIVKLLASYGGEIIERVYATGVTTSMAARQNNHHEIADYLDQLQKRRYEKLKLAVNREKNGKLFLLGLFADNKSNLYQGLGDAAKDVATKIFSCM